MRLDWLRTRLLLAIPVSLGCGGKAPKVEEPEDEDDPAPAITEDAPAARERPSDAGPPPPSPEGCALKTDSVFETVCGDLAARGSACTSFAERASVGPSSRATLYVTSPSDREALRAFTLDPDRTDRYRMAHDGAGCCYVH